MPELETKRPSPASYIGPLSLLAGTSLMTFANDSPHFVRHGGEALGVMALIFLANKTHPKLVSQILEKAGVRNILLPAAVAGVTGNLILSINPGMQIAQQLPTELIEVFKDKRLLLVVANGALWLSGNTSNLLHGVKEQLGILKDFKGIPQDKAAALGVAASVCVLTFGKLVGSDSTAATGALFAIEAGQRYIESNPIIKERLESIAKRRAMRRKASEPSSLDERDER